MPPPGKSFRVLVFPSDNPAATLLLPPLNIVPTSDSEVLRRVRGSRFRAAVASPQRTPSGDTEVPRKLAPSHRRVLTQSLSFFSPLFIFLLFPFASLALSFSLSVSSVSAVPTEKLDFLHRGASAFRGFCPRERDRRRCSLVPPSLSLSLSLFPLTTCLSLHISRYLVRHRCSAISSARATLVRILDRIIAS